MFKLLFYALMVRLDAANDHARIAQEVALMKVRRAKALKRLECSRREYAKNYEWEAA